MLWQVLTCHVNDSCRWKPRLTFCWWWATFMGSRPGPSRWVPNVSSRASLSSNSARRSRRSVRKPKMQTKKHILVRKDENTARTSKCAHRERMILQIPVSSPKLSAFLLSLSSLSLVGSGEGFSHPVREHPRCLGTGPSHSLRWRNIWQERQSQGEVNWIGDASIIYAQHPLARATVPTILERAINKSKAWDKGLWPSLVLRRVFTRRKSIKSFRCLFVRTMQSIMSSGVLSFHRVQSSSSRITATESTSHQAQSWKTKSCREIYVSWIIKSPL